MSITELERATAAIDASMPDMWGTDQWPDPMPIGGTVYEPEPYPLDALPEVLRDAIEEVRVNTQAPLAMVATCALTTLSVAAQGLVNVERDSLRIGPCSLFSITFAESGERKTTVDNHFIAAIREYERNQIEVMKPEVDEWRANHQVWSAKRAGLLDGIKADVKKGGDTGEKERQLHELERSEPLPPKVPHILHGDITTEELAYGLARKFPLAGVVSSEAGVVFGGHSMGSETITRNLAVLNVFWEGGEHRVGRRTTESFIARNARLTMGLQVQKSVFIEFMRKAGNLARGSGFLARFLVSEPASTQGTRMYRPPNQNMAKLAAFNRRITQILNTPLTYDETGDGLKFATLSMTPDAHEIWVKFYNLVEAQLSEDGELSSVRDVASKSAENAARIAALLHVFEHGTTGLISAAHMTAGCKVAAWHLGESRRLFSELIQSPELHLAAKLDEWLINQCNARRTNRIGQVEVLQKGPVRKLRKKSELAPVLQELIDADRVATATEGRATTIIVNPKLLAGGVTWA